MRIHGRSTENMEETLTSAVKTLVSYCFVIYIYIVSVCW